VNLTTPEQEQDGLLSGFKHCFTSNINGRRPNSANQCHANLELQREEPDGRKPPMTGDVEYQTHSRQNIPFRRQWIQVEKGGG
jgi:hypothetical protein